MIDYIRNANHLSAELKRTAHRVRLLHDVKRERAPHTPPTRMWVSVDGKLYVPEFVPRVRHRMAHTRPVAYKMIG